MCFAKELKMQYMFKNNTLHKIIKIKYLLTNHNSQPSCDHLLSLL